MRPDYRLTEKDALFNLLTEEEIRTLKDSITDEAGVVTDDKGLEQEMYYKALLMAVPRLEEKLRPDKRTVILTPNDVHSVLLTAEERTRIDAEYKKAVNALFEQVFKPLYHQLQQKKDALLDKIAQQAGFAQFDENEAGNGLRNYTALKKPMTEKIKQQVEDFHRIYDESQKKGEVKEYNRLSKNLSDWNEYMHKEFRQVMLRNILAVTNPRISRTDAMGKPYLTPEDFIERKKNIENVEEKYLFEAAYTSKVTGTQGSRVWTFNADKGIAPFLQQLNDAGYVTGQSCSGLLEDHPNYRYVQDDKRGRFVNGECIHFNKQGCGTYLTFYKPLKGEHDLNVQQQIDNIRTVAEENNWVVEDMDIFGIPSIRLGLPLTYDGLGTRELLDEVNDTVDRDFPGLYDTHFLDWLEERNSREPEFQERHGGVVRWTDDMVKAKWNALTQALVVAEKQRQDIERISDVRIYMGGDGQHRIKCRIDGEDMLSEHFSDANMALLNKGTDEKLLAYRCYADRFQNGPEWSKFFKR